MIIASHVMLINAEMKLKRMKFSINDLKFPPNTIKYVYLYVIYYDQWLDLFVVEYVANSILMKRLS